MKKIVNTIIMLFFSIILPLLFKPVLFMEWPVWVVIAAGVFLGMSQPTMKFEKESNDTYDHLSMHWIVIAVMLCFVVSIIDYAFGEPKEINGHQISTWIGLILIVFGFVFRYWSIKVLGQFFTTKVEILSNHELIQMGPYKVLRHPSYTGAWIGTLGIPILLHSLWGIVVCVAFYLPVYAYRIHCEEKALSRKFGPQYDAYQKKTWRLFPFIY